MLPQIFRKNDPVLSVTLPRETRSALDDLLKSLSTSVFQASDSLGWVYQFWQADRKDEINESGVKIGAEELPAVTQLFTEDYMVFFLLHNTIGAWWAGKVLNADPDLAGSANGEDELRAACKVGDIEWDYLRFVRDADKNGETAAWRPAAGTFKRWPNAAKALTVLDPCMGSGHFLVFALPIIVALRMSEEGLSQDAAIDAVLRDNLFGLEIDLRCTQIAAFNLALAAWRMGGYRILPRLNLACSGLAIGVSRSDWLKLAETAVSAADIPARRDLFGVEKNLFASGLKVRVKNGLETLYDLFAKAPWLGSLIDPRRVSGDLFHEDYEQLEALLAPMLAAAEEEDTAEIVVAAQGIAKAADLLSNTFSFIVTNVPYLGRPKQDGVLREFCLTAHPAAKSDIATCFMDRFESALSEGGSMAVVTPQSWLSQSGYRDFRTKLLRTKDWHFIARLGEGGFESQQAAGAFTALSIISKAVPSDDHMVSSMDLSGYRTPERKAAAMQSDEISVVFQRDQVANPDSVFIFSEMVSGTLLSQHAFTAQGFATSDNPPFVRRFWELPLIGNGWVFVQSAPLKTLPYTGRSDVLLWEEGQGRYFRHAMALKEEGRLGGWKSGGEAWGKRGVLVSELRSMPATLYGGEMFDHTAHALLPTDAAGLPALWEFCQSAEFREQVRKVSPKLNVTNETLVKIPFEFELWQAKALDRYRHGLPEADCSDCTQWLFSGLPHQASSPLHVAVSRLLGYVWPRQSGSSFVDFPALTSVDIRTHDAADGIVCLSALKGEFPGAQRLLLLLAEAFGTHWSAARLDGFLADVGFAGKTLDDWLRDGFFEQHCNLFEQRPFIWHIWDGRRDGFQAMVNYHRLAAPQGEGRRTLEKLIYSYLGDWIDRQRADQKVGVEGADGRLGAAEHLRAELTKILEGEARYDIFVRWKPLHEQPIGWEPDINDGVRLNIRPFMTARPFAPRSATACVLRNTPKISWSKDRGKEPTRARLDYPWFWNCDEKAEDFAGGQLFDGNRWNNLHYRRAIKQEARDRRAYQKHEKE